MRRLLVRRVIRCGFDKELEMLMSGSCKIECIDGLCLMVVLGNGALKIHGTY